MAKLTSNESALFECVAKADIINAQAVLGNILASPKYASDGEARRLKEKLERNSISNAMDIVENFARRSERASSLVRGAGAAAYGGEDSLSELIEVTRPEDIVEGPSYFTKDEIMLVGYAEKRMRSAGGLRKAGISIPTTILLHGRPGTGKTTFARLLSKRLGLPFAEVRTSTLVSCRLGETGRNIARIASLLSHTEAFVFIDEIDALGAVRGLRGELAEMGRVTIALMRMLDGLAPGTVLAAATNRPDILDPALMRRFSKKFEVRPYSWDDAVRFAARRLGFVHKNVYTITDIMDAIPRDAVYTAADLSLMIGDAMASAWPDPPPLKTIFKECQ